MHYFECNAPGTTGYSVATDGFDIYAIHAHHRNKKSVSIYTDPSLSSLSLHWIYMPVDREEYLTEICRQYITTHRPGVTYLRIMVRNLVFMPSNYSEISRSSLARAGRDILYLVLLPGDLRQSS